VMIQEDQTVAFSTNHFTVRKDDTPVNEWLSFRVHAGGDVEVHSRFLNAANYALLQQGDFDCHLGKGIQFHW
jgi:hypothetical protein